MAKPTVGIFGLTGCAGDQLVILNCEDQLLDLIALVDIRDFLMASSQNCGAGPLDLALVEGAVLTKRDEEDLKTIRSRAKTLIAIGTCAVWGGVAAMDRGCDRASLLREVYGEMGAEYDSMPTKALRELVTVDVSIAGCPIETDQFVSAIAGLLNGDLPVYPEYPVCTECRMRENNCLLMEQGQLCCGPVTAAGCKARCPGLRVACVGCRGPARDENSASLLASFEERGFDRQRIAARLRTFAPTGVTA